MAINIVIFASGSGSNAEQIIHHFSKNSEINVAGVLSNKPSAYVLERAKKLNVPSAVFDKTAFRSDSFLELLKEYQADFIVLAGFLWKIPDYLIEAFPNKIINIHPALLPNYGGKGMYGEHVHEAVIASGDHQSGITIHLVNENYDEGRILFQASCEVEENDTPDSLASKIHKLEHQYFPGIVEDYIVNFE